MDSNQPPVELRRLSVDEFLCMAHSPDSRPGLDKHIDDLLSQEEGASERHLLRVCIFLLHAIGTSVGWNDEDERGLDSTRGLLSQGLMFPTFRQCIGALLLRELTKPDDRDPPRRPESTDA